MVLSVGVWRQQTNTTLHFLTISSNSQSNPICILRLIYAKATCPSCKYNRVEFLDYFRQWIEDGRHVIFSPHSHFCSFIIQVTPSIDAGEFGAPPAASDAQTIGEAAAGVACRPADLDPVLEICRGMAVNVARITPRYRRALAPRRFSALLELEKSTAVRRPTAC